MSLSGPVRHGQHRARHVRGKSRQHAQLRDAASALRDLTSSIDALAD